MFEIYGKLNIDLNKEAKRDVIEHAMTIIDVAVTELFEESFKQLNFDSKNDLIGFWYSNHDPEPIAKWEKGQFLWMK